MLDPHSNNAKRMKIYLGMKSVKLLYEGGSESSAIGVITLLIDMIDCCIIPLLKGLHCSFIMMPKQCTNEIILRNRRIERHLG